MSKYIGGGDDPGRKRLSKLGGTEWEKSKTKAKKAAKDMAKGLIQLYAQRQRLAGHAFAPANAIEAVRRAPGVELLPDCREDALAALIGRLDGLYA